MPRMSSRFLSRLNELDKEENKSADEDEGGTSINENEEYADAGRDSGDDGGKSLIPCVLST